MRIGDRVTVSDQYKGDMPATVVSVEKLGIWDGAYVRLDGDQYRGRLNWYANRNIRTGTDHARV